MSFTIRLLGKLGHIPRTYKNKIEINNENNFRHEDMEFVMKCYLDNKKI